jgi:hypothetical protein
MHERRYLFVLNHILQQVYCDLISFLHSQGHLEHLGQFFAVASLCTGLHRTQWLIYSAAYKATEVNGK